MNLNKFKGKIFVFLRDLEVKVSRYGGTIRETL